MNDDKIKKSLRYSIIDGSFYSAMVGFGESFFSAFAVYLKATNMQLGILGSLPHTLGSISQLWANNLIKYFKSRKRFILYFVFFEALLYIPIMLTFLMDRFAVNTLIILLCIYWVLGMILGPAWSSWMGDLVNENERGTYFGNRNRIAGLVCFATLMAGGYILQVYSHNMTNGYLGFVIIFTLALFARLMSFYFLSRKWEPEYKPNPEVEFTFAQFLKEAWHRNFGKFAFFLGLMNLAVYISAPFFTAYMLNDLKFDYMTFTVVTAAAIVAKHLAMPSWGKLADKFGTIKVLALTSFLMPLVPFLWVIKTDVWYLIAIQIYSGIVWAGFELTSFDFIFDATTPQKRAICVSYHNVVNGAFILIGGLIGGLIVKYNHVFWSKYYLVFMISFIARYAVAAIFIPKLKEVRKVSDISYGDLVLKVVPMSPAFDHVYKRVGYVIDTSNKQADLLLSNVKKHNLAIKHQILSHQVLKNEILTDRRGKTRKQQK